MKEFTIFNQLTAMPKRLAMVLTVLLTLGVGSMLGETRSITLTQSALGLTGSYTTNTEKTIDGVTFKYSNLMKNNDNIQAQASGGEIYNRTAIPGNIVSVAVTHSGTAKSSTIYFGTSEKATTESSTFSGTKTIEPTSDYKYFYIKRGSNAAYWTQIVITYETSAGGGGGGSGSGGCEWQLVTDASTLKAGDRVVIAAKDYNFAISTTQNSNNRGQAAITKSGSTISEPSNSVQILTLEAGKKSGSLAFNTGSGYLYAASSSSNYLRTETTLSNNSSWTISIANSTATITAQGSNTNKVMQYNQSSSLFACYGSASQKALVIYKEVCTSSAPTTYTVTYALNGGIGTIPTETAKAEGDKFNLAASTGLSKDGCRFVGWNDGTTTYEAGAQYTMPANAVTFTAQWSQEFTVTYDANGGTPTCTDNNKYIQGETVTICANIPTKSDVTFAGWSDGTNTYLQNATFTMPAKNVTLTAQWTQKVYTVTATSNNNNYGTVSVSGATITASPKTGYTYANPAYTVTSGSAIVTQNGNTFTVTPSTNCTIQINFEAKPKCTVTLNAGPGTCDASVTETSAGDGVTLPTPTIDCGDWTFAGWKETSAISTETTTEPTLHSAGSNYKPSADCTLYAVYSRTETSGGSGDYELVTSEPLDWSGTYLIVNTDDTKAWKGSATSDNNAIDVTITNNTIASTATTDAETFTIATMTGGYSICGASGKYISGTSGSNTTNYGATAALNTITIDGDNNVKITSNTSVLRQNNSTASLFRYYKSSSYSSQHPIQLYKKSSGGSSVTYYNSNPECGAEQLDTPNVNVSEITTSSAKLSWDAVPNATQGYSFVIKSGETIVKNISSGATYYTADNLLPGTTYTYTVVAKGNGTNYSDSDPATGTFTTACAIQWFVNGELEEITDGMNGDEIVMPKEEPTSCDPTKEFVGWTATPIDGSTDEEPNDLFTSSPGEITGNATYYAVFANATGGGSVDNTDYSNVHTSNVTLTNEGGTNATNSKVKISEVDYTAVKAGTGNAQGAVKITVPAGTTKLSFHMAGWNGEGGKTISLSGATADPSSFKTVTDAGVSGNSTTYTLSGTIADYFYSTTLSNIDEETTLTFSNGGADQRFVIWGVNVSSGSGSSYSGYVTTCCKQSKTPLTITADQIELVKSGVVTLTATGGNGTNITWTTTGGELSNQSNTGATLTISNVDATQNITITATQAENNNDDEVVYCAQEASIDITVKAQWTITFWTNDNGNKESNSMTVTDGESYTMPDISDEYICTNGHSFAGWVDNEADKELDATPNSTQTATANQTWYAAWSSSSNTKSVDIYQLVTDVTNLTAGNKVWITNATPTVAMGGQNSNNRGQVTVTNHPTESDKIYSTGSPAILTVGKENANYTFHDGTGFLYAASSSSNHLKTQATNNDNGKWSISIANDGVATIKAQGTNTRNWLRYNDGSDLFSCYASGQKDVRIYKNVGTAEIEVSGASITTTNTSCHRGAVISAENGKWITSSKGQKVRIAINVTARGFNSDATLSATSANEHFSVVSITNTTITKNSAFETQMMIEYQPAEANTNENAEITLVAKNGEEVVATRTIDVNGRSLPDEFVIVAQYGDKWLALPANMQSGADQYNGIEVTPNNALTQIPAAPSTTIYSLRGVADNRYEAAGTCVRLVGNGNKCLWGNAANTNTTIQNWTTLASTNGSNYEWLLTTSDGELYTIANPAHPDYNEGRILSNSGSKYGLYKGTTKFYILPVGCSSQPGNIQVTARRVDATFSWEGNASSMTIDVYTNDAMTAGKISNTTTASPYYMTGLSESTQYWFQMTPNGTDVACAYTGTFKTTGPTIDVVEWQENAAVIFVDKDDELNPLVVIDGEVEHGVGGTKATDIFFSKYFEAQSEAKLLAIYNGTANAISLADITILQRGTKHSSTYVPLSLAPYGKTPGWIQPGEELILYNEDQSAYSEDIMKCAESDPTFSNWVKVDNNNLAFSGKGTVRLFRGDKCIDIIGAMGSVDDIDKKEITPLEGTEKPSFGDKEGFTTATGDNYSTLNVETDYTLSTNRCLLVRKPSVTSGAIAVEKNIGDFKTLGNDYDGIANEWAGLQVPTGPSDDKYKYTCEGFQEVGSFDYNNYYKEYNNIDDDTYLKSYTHDAATKEYIIPIENLAKYSCLNIRFQLKKGDQVLTEEPVQVPIIVSGEKATNDAIFNAIVKTDGDLPVYNQSIERCKTCNVVVLSEATLTKAANGTANDVGEVANLKIYPGGQVVVPAETNYTVNSLAFRRQEDEVSMANIQGTLNVKHTNGVYLDVRIDPSNWHYMTLPYDCRVGDVTFADGTPAVVNTDYLLGWYDGAYRAEHKTGGWTYITDNDYILKKGLGYIVALPGSGQVRREIRFPMANDVIAQDLTSKTVSGLYAYGGDKTDAELRPNHKGWNMIGSPYLYTYTTDIVKEPLQMGTLEHSPVDPWDGTWVRTEDARYIVEPIDNGWSGYRQTTISNLKPFTSYFIQVGGVKNGEEYTTVTPETEQQIVFAANSVARNASAPRKVAEAEVMDNHPVWYGVEMIAPNNEKDNTTLLISDEFTDGYDMMDDLVKMRGDYYQYYNFPVLASNNNEGEMAFNALPDSSAAKIGVPLSYYAATAGTYTIATDGRFDLEEVKAAMLYDATTAQYTNLLTENYSFTTNKGNNTNRFTLFVTVERRKVPNITTGMDNLLANGQLSLIAVERTLVLSGLTENADIYVYDMSGKMVTGMHSAGESGIWRTTVPATGVYFVRVNSANSQQTLRTIVK